MRVLYTFIIAILLPLLLSAQNQKETYTLNLNRYYGFKDIAVKSFDEANIFGDLYLEVPHNIKASLYLSEYDIKDLPNEDYLYLEGETTSKRALDGDDEVRKTPISKTIINWIELLDFHSKQTAQILAENIDFGESIKISKSSFSNNGKRRFIYLSINIPDDIRDREGDWLFDDKTVGKLNLSSFSEYYHDYNRKGVLGIHIGDQLNYNNRTTDLLWRELYYDKFEEDNFIIFPIKDPFPYITSVAISSDRRILLNLDKKKKAYSYLLKITMDDFDNNGNLKVSFGFKNLNGNSRNIINEKTKIFSEIKSGKGTVNFLHKKAHNEVYTISKETYVSTSKSRDEDFGIEVKADEGYEIDKIEFYSYNEERNKKVSSKAYFLNIFDKFRTENYSSKGNFSIHLPKEQSVSNLRRLRAENPSLPSDGKYVVSFRPIKYDVLLSNSLNGNIELSKKGKVDKGTKVYIKNINPADGYKLDKILINERELNEDFFIVNENTKVEALFVFEEDKVMNIENASYGADIFSSYEIRELEENYKVKYGKIDISPNDGFILKDIEVKCKNRFEYNGNKLISNGEWISLKSIDAEIFSNPKDNYEIGLFDKETIVRLSFEYSSSVKFRKLVIKESPLGEIIVRDNKTGEEYKKGTIKLPLNSKLILSSNYDKSKYTLRGFMVNGIKLRGYTLNLVEDTELSIDLEDISETNSLSKLEVEVEKLENGSYRLYMPVEYIDKDLRIYDSLGNLIENHKIESSISEISLWNLPSGIYLIKIEKTVIKIKHKNN